MEHAHVKSRVKIHGRLIDPEKIKSPSGQQGPFRLPEKSLDTAVVSSQVPSELRLLNESVDVMWAAVYRLREGLSSIAGPSGSDQVGLAPQKLSGVITHLADEIWAVRGRVNVLVRELRALIDGCQL